jgi:hypothetical protein
MRRVGALALSEGGAGLPIIVPGGSFFSIYPLGRDTEGALNEVVAQLSPAQ